MPEQNVAIVRGMYAAFPEGDVPTVVEKMDPEIVWNEGVPLP